MKTENWNPKTKTPLRKGWYLTRRDDGYVSWRAWGNGEWWKQCDGGWISWFNVDGTAHRFEWLSKPRIGIETNQDELPEVYATIAEVEVAK